MACGGRPRSSPIRSHPPHRCSSRRSSDRRSLARSVPAPSRPTAPSRRTGRCFRRDAGFYYARVPALNVASTRSTNGSLGQTLFGSSPTIPFNLPPPAYDSLLPLSTGVPDHPQVYVFDKDFRNPRTFNLTVGYERQVASDLAASISYTHART